MSDELRPCPFCGGEAQVVRKPYETKFGVGCGDDACLGFSGLGWLYETEEQAAAAWNRRAERTCSVESSDVEQEMGSYAYLEVELSCGHAFTWDDGTPPDYCPYCGARVVSGDD